MHLRSRQTDTGLFSPVSRQVVAAVLAVAAGVAIAWLDSRPGWDSTGITAVSLAGIGFLATVIAGRRMWLWALLASVWTPLIEITQSGQTASVAAVLFASIGAGAGWVLVRESGRT